MKFKDIFEFSRVGVGLIQKSLRRLLPGMKSSVKRSHDDIDAPNESSDVKVFKRVDRDSWFSDRTDGNGKLIPKHIADKFTDDDIKLLETVKSDCTDLDLIKKAIRFRKEHRLCVRLPENRNDSDYYIKNGLRHVYPYPYLYQTYAKRRWLGNKLIDVLKREFRDITHEQLIKRFEMKLLLVNGEPVDHKCNLKDNDFISNSTHRHELPVLATPIKKIYEDKELLVVDKPPSVPIHTCGRYRHNSVVGILEKQYNYEKVRVVHRLDRLVSGVLITAKNKTKAHNMEQLIKNRDVQKEYVCRVAGNFPDGKAEDDGYIIVDQPLDIIKGKIGFSVVSSDGKPSLTKFKKLNFNGKTSAVLCQPKTGRMHQIRVHLQYLGYPIVNDYLYNCDSFGPEVGKGARYGKSWRQLSADLIKKHRAHTWMISDDNDIVDTLDQGEQADQMTDQDETPDKLTARFLSKEEHDETMAALEHFFTNESWKDLEEKYQYDSTKDHSEPNCRDCQTRCHDPPLRRMFLYLHALRYSGTGWSYQSDLPVWAGESWTY